MCRKDHLRHRIWLIGSQSINASNVALYIVLLCISELPTPYQFKNKIRTVEPQNFGKIKNSQLESQFYWFLQRRA